MITLKRKVFGTCLLVATLVAITGCSSGKISSTPKDIEGVVSAESIVSKQPNDEIITSSEKEGNTGKEVKSDIPIVELPEGIEGEKAETVKNDEKTDYRLL